MGNRKTISLTVEIELHKEARKYCIDTGRTLSGLINLLLKRELINATNKN